MTFLQKLANDKINGDHPLRLELDQSLADVLGSIWPQTLLSHAHLLVFWIAPPSALCS